MQAIRHRQTPEFADGMHRAFYHYVTSLLNPHSVDDEVYRCGQEALGELGLIELTALLGHYSNVALTLIAHRVPLPDGARSPFAAN